MTLKKFSKNEINRKNIILIVIVFISVSILLLGASYALYQRETEVQFINAKVRFPNASEISYTNISNSNITNVEQALNELYGKLGK